VIDANVATVWKDGKVLWRLTKNGGSVESLAVSGSNVYAGGYVGGPMGRRVATIWKNGKSSLAPDEGCPHQRERLIPRCLRRQRVRGGMGMQPGGQAGRRDMEERQSPLEAGGRSAKLCRLHLCEVTPMNTNLGNHIRSVKCPKQADQ
jgi:hypothetical protein